MKKAERAAFVLAFLQDRYPETPVPLDHTDPYTLLVAVLLSAQSTDKKVNEITPALFDAGPTPQAMAAVEVPAIRELIRTVGLAPTKAKNLQALSQQLVDRPVHRPPCPESLAPRGHRKNRTCRADEYPVPHQVRPPFLLPRPVP